MKFKKTISLLLILTIMLSFSSIVIANNINDFEPEHMEPMGFRSVTKQYTMTGSELQSIVNSANATNMIVRLATAAIVGLPGWLVSSPVYGFLCYAINTLLTGTQIVEITNVDTQILDMANNGTLSSLPSVRVDVTYRETYGLRTGQVYEATPTQIRLRR